MFACLKWLTIFIFRTSDRYMEEQLRCNICGVTVSSSQAKQHVSTPSHASLKSKLEDDLDAVKKESYKNDSSVVIRWEKSV